MHIDPYLSPSIKLKFNQIKDFNLKPVVLNLIEKKVENSLEHVGTGDNFLERTPIAQVPINEWDFIKWQSFCKWKEPLNRTKLKPSEWEKIFINYKSDRGLISKIYKELKKVYVTKPNN